MRNKEIVLGDIDDYVMFTFTNKETGEAIEISGIELRKQMRENTGDDRLYLETREKIYRKSGLKSFIVKERK